MLDFRSILFQNFRLSCEKEDFRYCTEIIISKEEMMKILRKCYRCDVFSHNFFSILSHPSGCYIRTFCCSYHFILFILFAVLLFTRQLYIPPAAIPLIVSVLLILMSSIRKSFQITKIFHPRLSFQDFRLSQLTFRDFPMYQAQQMFVKTGSLLPRFSVENWDF